MALALTFDRSVASSVAAKAEDDELLQRKLWLAIACHLIHAASDTSDAHPVTYQISYSARDSRSIIEHRM